MQAVQTRGLLDLPFLREEGALVGDLQQVHSCCLLSLVASSGQKTTELQEAAA